MDIDILLANGHFIIYICGKYCLTIKRNENGVEVYCYLKWNGEGWVEI